MCQKVRGWNGLKLPLLETLNNYYILLDIIQVSCYYIPTVKQRENIMKTINFNGFTCTVNITKYADGNNAILLNDAADGSPVATASVNMPDANIPNGHVCIKDWSENTGMLNTLVEAGVVIDTGRTIPSGFVEANVCMLAI